LLALQLGRVADDVAGLLIGACQAHPLGDFGSDVELIQRVARRPDPAGCKFQLGARCRQALPAQVESNRRRTGRRHRSGFAPYLPFAPLGPAQWGGDRSFTNR
jgi:hypothetical protein